MLQITNKDTLIQQLQREILSMQGLNVPVESQKVSFGLGVVEHAFPNEVFPTGVIHELISRSSEDAAATAGFMTTLVGRIMQKGGLCFWISKERSVFPPALKLFGADPDRVVFINLKSDKDLLWMVEEALKCDALCAVVGEIKELSLIESRRLQLAVEHSKVTGLLHRANPKNMSNTAAVARWRVTSIGSSAPVGMPGLGFAHWKVELLKVRNGKPGSWQLQWNAGNYELLHKPAQVAYNTELINTA